jgi:hypothetical protein
MVRHVLQWIHHGIGCALVLAAFGVCLGSARAQPGMRPPRVPGPVVNPPGPLNPRMPGMDGPVIKHVWTCSRCGHEIGDGAFPPAQCPFCGAKIINGVGPSQPGFGGGNGPPNPGGMPNMPGGVPPPNNPAPPPVPDNQQFPVLGPPVGNDPGPGNFNVPDGSLQRDAPSAGPGSSSGVRIAAVVLLGLAALLAVVVLIVVAVVVVYGLSARGKEAPRPRRRRRLAQQY